MSGLSTREQAHRDWLMSQPDGEPENPEFRSAPTSTRAENVAPNRVRDRANAVEFTQQQTDPSQMTPAEKSAAWYASAEQERLKFEKRGAEARAKQERIRQEAERVEAARRLDAQRDKEARQQFTAKIVADDLRKSIRAIIEQNDAYDIVSEVSALLKSWKLETMPEAWASAIREVRARKK